ncbi:MAG: adenine methyltransferase [Sulfurimonas sp.]|nr:MAG: adenine methyltransferase [Sulfurimonas sp.]
MYVKSPLNYTGGKFKLLNQIIPLFPKKIYIFCDIFAGGCNIGINIKANKIICNDINKEIIELFNYFKITNIEEILSELESTIYENNLSNSSKYGYEFYGCNSADGLSKYNKEFYTSLKNKYNLTNSIFFPLLLFIKILKRSNQKVFIKIY